MDNRLIGVFDSGVGGLSVLTEIQKLLPNENFIFLADQKNVPYGQKTKEDLEELTSKIVKFLVSKDVKMIVVACNTATVYTIDHLRENFSLPIVGVVPVIKTLAEVTENKKVGVLSTPATSKSDYLQKLIQKYADGVEVSNRDGAGLEGLVEKGDLDSSEINQTLDEVLLPLKAAGIDALALGCTHYPFLREKIQKVLGPDIKVIDSGGAVARQVERILTNNNSLNSKKGEDFYFTTGNKDNFKMVAEKLLKKKLVNVDVVNLDYDFSF